MKDHHINKTLMKFFLILLCLTGTKRYFVQGKDGYHVHPLSKRGAVTGKAFSTNFKLWTHDDNGSVDLDMIAGHKQSRRQRYAALGRASYLFIEKKGDKKCSVRIICPFFS